MESGNTKQKETSSQGSVPTQPPVKQQIVNSQIQHTVNKPWYLNPEMIVALSALIIGIVTTFTSIYSAAIDRAYARASVWPSIEIARGHDLNSFKYIVTNNGTGPAIIKYAKVKYGKKYLFQWHDVDLYQGIIQSHIGKTILPSQKSIFPLLYQGNKVNEFLTADNSVTIELCYCSIYDECWTVDRNNDPLEVSQCAIDSNQRFLQ